MKHLFPLFLSCLLACGSLTATATPEIMRMQANTDTVGLYEKFELQIRLKANYVNPFDPNELDLIAIFTAPSGKQWRITGFYNYTDWQSTFMVRFSPQETGTWRYELSVQDRDSLVRSEPASFVAVRSGRKGPVRVAKNGRYLEHLSGEPFYGVGFWYNDNYAGFNSGRIDPDELDHLKQLGVNFISTYITPLETLGSGLGRYDQNICGRLDEVFAMLEERDMQLSLNLWFHSYISETVWGGGNIRWDTNPYQQICRPEDFFRSKLAWEYQKQLYRYFIARWGYSRSLAIWFIVDEVNGTEGWKSGDTLMAADWGRRVHDYLKSHDPYQHLTTGTRSGGIREFWHEGYETFDIAAREIYEAQGFPIVTQGTIDSTDVHPLTHSYTNYAREIDTLWRGYGRPAIIGETGWDHTFYEPHMPGYLAQFHNANWVCLATGAAMTPFWWAHSPFRMNDMIVNTRLGSIRRFTDEIPFSQLRDIAPLTSASAVKSDVYAMKSEQLTFGWAVHPDTDVVGDRITLRGLKPGNYRLRLYHTWRGAFIHEENLNSSDGTVSFSVPVLKIEGSHANYWGQDVAFILQPQ